MRNRASIRPVLGTLAASLSLLIAPFADAQQIASLEHDTVNGTYNSLVQVDVDTYALAYSGDGSDGFIKTFNISADGATISQVASLEHDTVNGIDNSLVHYTDYLRPIDEVEAKTGLDFFWALNDAAEDDIEDDVDTEAWTSAN